MVTELRSRDPFSIVWATHGKGRGPLTDSGLRRTLGTVCRGHPSDMCVWGIAGKRQKRTCGLGESKPVSGDISISLDSVSRGERKAEGKHYTRFSRREVKAKTGREEFPVKRTFSLPLSSLFTL